MRKFNSQVQNTPDLFKIASSYQVHVDGDTFPQDSSLVSVANTPAIYD